MTRRTALLTAAACVAVPRRSHASALSMARELRRMVGFQIIAVDDVRQSWKSRTPPAGRFIELRGLGLFKETTITPRPDPIAPAEAIVFARPFDKTVRQRYPGLSESAYLDYRLLIDGEFFEAVHWE